MIVAVLALQGAFLEHQEMLSKLEVESVQIRNLNDWNAYVAGQMAAGSKGALIIPGGESTAMTRIIRDEALYEPVRKAIADGMPVFGTCAGLIMLDAEHLGTMGIHVKRNAYGRQLGSFHADADFKGIGQVPMTFIRAPYIESVDDGVEVLSVVDGHIVAARQGKQLVTAFHPELDDSLAIHKLWLEMVRG